MERQTEIMKQGDARLVTHETEVRNVAPMCDVYENADEYLVIAEVPGVRQDSLDVRLDRTRLSIVATRDPTEDGAPARRYTRVFEIPDTIDAPNICAALEQGVLNVHLPKAPQARVRRIAVKAG